MTKDMTEGEPAKLILFFTLPLIAGNIFQQLYAFVDTLIVGRFLGVDALASVGCTGSLMFLMIGFIAGLTGGLTIVTGQRFGAKDEKGVRQSTACCIIIGVGSGIVLSIIGVLFCRTFLVWMQTPPEILEGAYDFISIVFAGMMNFVFLQLQTNLIRALGDSKMPTIILASALVINIILEPIAILVFEWGIPGAALATVAAQLCGNILAFVYIVKKVPILHVRREDWKLTRDMYKTHLRIGLPMGFQTSIIAIGAIVLQIALNNLGPIAVASYAASQKVDSIAMMPMMSFGLAMAAYTAQNYGARKYARIAEGVKKCIYMSVSFSIVAGIFLVTFGADIMKIFVGDAETTVIEYGQQYLVIQSACYWILSLLFIFRCTLQGLGQSTVPTLAGVMELIMRSAAALILCSMFGFLGACWASPMAWFGSCVPLAIAYFITRNRMRKQIRMQAESGGDMME